MDFYTIQTRGLKGGGVQIYPDFKVCRSKDLMIRGKSFYGVWDEQKGLWSTDEYDVARLIDQELSARQNDIRKDADPGTNISVKWMGKYSSRSWSQFKSYISNVADNAHQLDSKLCFADTPVTKKDYISRRLPYALQPGPYDAYDELIGTLYSPEQRAKIEWAIGSIVAGDSQTIQKFLVFYGAMGTGKSTIMNIVKKLFAGYCTQFDAAALTSINGAFATEVFRTNPLVGIQQDGNLSRIEDNTRLNSIVSHEDMTMNEKYKSSYSARSNAFLFMGTNQPVRITDSKSGIIRRLIDVEPTGNLIPSKRYDALVAQVDFELGAIAQHCLDVYRDMGKHYYDSYIPLKMMFKTDMFFNYVEDNFETFKEQNGTTLKAAYALYKAYCEQSGAQRRLPQHKFRQELKSYFDNFEPIARVGGKQVRSWFSGFKSDKFSSTQISKPKKISEHISLVLDCTTSLLDDILANCKAQLAVKHGKQNSPGSAWDNVTTTLKDIDTSKVHYVMIPDIHHIVIDFDLKDDQGKKSMEKNLQAASKFPPTYAQFSQGGSGVHLHYIYDGDPLELNRVYSPGIEVKVFTGKSSLRRRVSKCNNIPIAHISSGLPVKEVSKTVDIVAIQNEKHLRTLIAKNLNKEIHAGTKPSVDFIDKILNDAYSAGVHFDVTDMRPAVLAFAANSTNHADYCIKKVAKMKFRSQEPSDAVKDGYSDQKFVFFDIEVFPNLLLVNWKFQGDDQPCHRMINPTPDLIEQLFKYKLIGFNCRRYDNHILYACYQGYTNQELYNLSQRIVSGSKNSMFGQAYNISYTDVLDFSSVKQSLKKFEIELGIHHQELGLPWDQSVPPERWEEVALYCDNDVIATEAVFNDRHEDWSARQILAEVSGLTVNDTTNQHTTKIIFGDEKEPQKEFVYTDLSEMFPGYSFVDGVSTYRGEVTGEGGYVYSEPGMYGDVALLDIASMHPTSMEQLNLFGPYTKRFSELKAARIAVKHNDIQAVNSLLGGVLNKYMGTKEQRKALAYSLKIAINSVYGLTSAKFENKFRDPRNIDNIVAKRGALFMIDLKHAVQQRGYKVAHIKTDSIKIPDATPQIIDFVMRFGKSYGYNFEHEATYDRMCLVNDSTYIARYAQKQKCQKLYGYIPDENNDHPFGWTATAAQFAQPYVFKTLFSKEPILFADMCETKTVTSALYLDMNENLPEGEHAYRFVGKAGSFCPIKPGRGGGSLCREKDGKFYSATGAKGYLWEEAEILKTIGDESAIDRRYYDKLVDAAVESISKYGDFEWFVSDDPYITKEAEYWKPPCGDMKYQTCVDCPKFDGNACRLNYTGLK